MPTEKVVPMSPEAARALTEARLMGQFDALYEVGGLEACLRLITLLMERLAGLMKGSLRR